MSEFNKTNLNNNSKINSTVNDIKDDGKVLKEDSEKLAGEIYNEGVNYIDATKDSLKNYSDELLVKIKQKPITSVAVAAGVGFLISLILRK